MTGMYGHAVMTHGECPLVVSLRGQGARAGITRCSVICRTWYCFKARCKRRGACEWRSQIVRAHTVEMLLGDVAHPGL